MREDDVLTSAEAAAFLKVNPRTVVEEAKRGRLPGRRMGKGWRFSRKVLEDWLASGPDAYDIERDRWKSSSKRSQEKPPS
ncbi:MAG: helix-turn-helix domain-containing protein [Actinomycetota bacterium]